MTDDIAFFNWVEEHRTDNPSTLRLKYGNKKEPIDYADAILQIECRKKFGKKLADTLAAFPGFYFPSTLAGEQSTSDRLAEYHTSLVPEGLTAADLTAGLGIDVLHIAARASNVTAIERNGQLVEALRYNAAGLHAVNVNAVNADCREWLDDAVEKGEHFGVIFIDPARRASDGSRVFALADCEPNIIEMLPKLKRVCELLIVKMSPMLDISHTVSELNPFSVIALGTPTECKELLAIVDFKEPEEQPLIEAVTLTPTGVSTFAFTAKKEAESPMTAGTQPSPGEYIYEPYPALMKSGAFKTIAAAYGVGTFHANTRLFHSAEIIENFPGNRYEIIEVMPYSSGVIKRFKKRYPAAGVAVRNFGMSAEALRAKLGIADGGSLRLYGITDSAGERLLILTKI